MKTFGKICAFILAIVLLAGGALGIGRAITGTWDVRDWGKPQTQVEQTENGEKGQESALIVTPENNQGASIGVTKSAVNGANGNNDILLTVVTEPGGTFYTPVDWSFCWHRSESSLSKPIDAPSSWESGKVVGDYIEVIPMQDDSMTFTLKAKQPFATSIYVTASCGDDAEATITAEYRVKVKDFNVILAGTNNADYTCSLCYSCEFTDGTVDSRFFGAYELNDSNAPISAQRAFTNLKDQLVFGSISSGNTDTIWPSLLPGSNVSPNEIYSGASQQYSYFNVMSCDLSASDKAYFYSKAYRLTDTQKQTTGLTCDSAVNVPMTFYVMDPNYEGHDVSEQWFDDNDYGLCYPFLRDCVVKTVNFNAIFNADFFL